MTVPVKLARATNDIHKSHSDAMFCRTTIQYLEELASVLGPTNVLFISQDDKVIKLKTVPFAVTVNCDYTFELYLGSRPHWKNCSQQARSPSDAYGI